jgi:hypothetical protein
MGTGAGSVRQAQRGAVLELETASWKRQVDQPNNHQKKTKKKLL